jgi:catalase
MREDEADRLIDLIAHSAPGHVPGTRPIHAPGIGVTGSFQATDVAARYTDAAHFSGRKVPVTVRFSNGVVPLDEPDTVPAVRGMAVRFHLDGATVTDMVCMTLPVFFTRTVPDFAAFVEAASTGPGPRVRWWQKLVALLRLAPALPPESRPTVAFADANAQARPAVVGLAGLPVPASYATTTYHSVHAFLLSAGDRVTAARFRWEPSAGVWPEADIGTPRNYLQEELRDRLTRGPAEFVLRMQVAEQGDDITDPTVAWPESRRRVVLGHLQIEAVAPDQVAGNEALGFDPTRLVPGIAATDDPILWARHGVYPRSADRRLEARVR